MWEFRKTFEVYGGNNDTTMLYFFEKEALYQVIRTEHQKVEGFLRQQGGGNRL